MRGPEGREGLPRWEEMGRGPSAIGFTFKFCNVLIDLCLVMYVCKLSILKNILVLLVCS